MSVDTQLITKMDCVDTQRAWWKGGCFGLVLALLAGSQAIAETQDGPERPLPNKRVLLVTGIDYPGHHWPQTAPELRQLLENDPRLIVRTTEEPESLSTLRVEDWDAIVLHFMNWEKPAPGEAARRNLQNFVRSGKGLVLVHFACGAWQDWPEFRELAGRVWDPKLRGHDPHGMFRVEIAHPDHPVVRGLKPFETVDELYTCLTGNAGIEVLASARSKVDGKDYPMAFVLNYGQGRVFHTVLGHDVRALTNSAVPDLIRRGCAWAAGLPVAADGVPARPSIVATNDPATGQIEVREGARPVLRYNYHTVEPGEVFNQVQPDNRKYAKARSDYIHPLYGLKGEVLTRDWPVDHPHHRGIYWAWPEVQFGEELGDLHALQRVFARPTGRCLLRNGPGYAEIDAENLWLWEDSQAIVRERAIIRAYRADAEGRMIDLELQFKALLAGVSIARRNTELYGGLNMRLAPIAGQQIRWHTDPESAVPRMAWADVSGTFGPGLPATGLTVLQSSANPGYPGDWVKYPELNWVQPTFPAAKARHALKPGRPLVLRYRIWIHPDGNVSDAGFAQQGRDYLLSNKPDTQP